MTLTRCLALIIHKSRIQLRIIICQCCNHSASLCCIGRIGNYRATRGEPLFFLYLYAFPRWIPQHHVKSARPASQLIFRFLALRGHSKHVGEGQVPVEELVLLRETPDLVAHPTSDIIWIFFNLTKNFFCDGIGEVFCLFPDEGCAPCISP